MCNDCFVSSPDRGGSDVWRRLHGGCCLSTHLPDHRQLSAVSPTQTVALWITLHEHAQRCECGLSMCDIHPSVRFTALYFISPGARAETIESGDWMWWMKSVCIIFEIIFPRRQGLTSCAAGWRCFGLEGVGVLSRAVHWELPQTGSDNMDHIKKHICSNFQLRFSSFKLKVAAVASWSVDVM